MVARAGSIWIEGVEPAVEDGKFPVKRIAGEAIVVRADLLKEGHEVLAGVVRHRQKTPAAEATEWQEAPLAFLGNDRWEASFVAARPGRYLFEVEAWPDTFRTWASELERKVKAGRSVASELLEGVAWLEEAASRAARTAPQDSARLKEAAQAVKGAPTQAIAAALDPGLAIVASCHADRALASRTERSFPIQVERSRAENGAWYEFFPRSTGPAGKHGTFEDAEKLLPEIKELGFDVVYLPPIHPIGRTARKGKNNSLQPTPDDVGSPWAIGAAEGGHKAVHPQLGTLEDFKRFRARAESLGLEVALDLAYQCAPDHPYVKEHPEWFNRRPDGTIKTAENPPKRYEDIVNFDFLGPARETLWPELRSVILFWIAQGVKIFRVDNPHTKPLPFWSWAIQSVLEEHPEVVFLAEAFTRPKVMKALAKVGFTQSYTYFTWRHVKGELREYLEEITQPPVGDYFRGNLWPNTPDILPEILQRGGPPAFRQRIALASTLSSTYGIYRGFELAEGRGIAGTEEYLDSEKYELKAWDLERPGNIRDWVRTLNRIRREHPAFGRYHNLRFCETGNDRVLGYCRWSDDRKSQVLVAVSLDPYGPQTSTFTVPLEFLGLEADEVYEATELIGGARSLWQGENAHVALTLDAPAAIWAVKSLERRETSFDYF